MTSPEERLQAPNRPELDPCPWEEEGAREEYDLVLGSDGAEFG